MPDKQETDVCVQQIPGFYCTGLYMKLRRSVDCNKKGSDMLTAAKITYLQT
jgi:hypothetical protein